MAAILFRGDELILVHALSVFPSRWPPHCTMIIHTPLYTIVLKFKFANDVHISPAERSHSQTLRTFCTAMCSCPARVIKTSYFRLYATDDKSIAYWLQGICFHIHSNHSDLLFCVTHRKNVQFSNNGYPYIAGKTRGCVIIIRAIDALVHQAFSIHNADLVFIVLCQIHTKRDLYCEQLKKSKLHLWKPSRSCIYVTKD